MHVSVTFIRLVFVSLSIIISTAYTTTVLNDASTIQNAGIGILVGLGFSALMVGIDTMIKRFNLRSFNITILGMFFGYLLGQAVVLILGTVLDFSPTKMEPMTETLIKGIIFLSAIYIGMIMTARAAGELYVSLPFIKFKSTSLKKKDILLDASVLHDPRLIDLAGSGLLDNHLIAPRFLVNDLYTNAERGEESQKARAKKGLEVIKKLESLSTLDLRYTDTDLPDIKDPHEKMIKLARLLDANIITADMSQIQQASVEDVRIIKFQHLCNALKPLSQSGEFISIKIQRYGKEPRQGVGYLDDGTMVVVNGGAEYIGESIRAQVLSVKHTSSGRMIFCNALEEDLFDGKDSYDEEEISLSTGTPLSNDDSINYLNL